MYLKELILEARFTVEYKYALFTGAPVFTGAPINKQLAFARRFKHLPSPQAKPPRLAGEIRQMEFVIQRHARAYLAAKAKYVEAVEADQLTLRNREIAKLTLNDKARTSRITRLRRDRQKKYRIFSEVCRLPSENGYSQIPPGAKENLDLMRSRLPKTYQPR